MSFHSGIMQTGGPPIRAIWGCGYCKEYEYFEPRGPRYWAPVVLGEQSTRCDCGRKLRRVG